MPMFRKRPVVIEARQLAGATSDVFSATYEPADEPRGES